MKNQSAQNEKLTEAEQQDLIHSGGVTRITLKQHLLKTLRHHMQLEPQIATVWLEQTPDGRILLIAEMQKTEPR